MPNTDTADNSKLTTLGAKELYDVIKNMTIDQLTDSLPVLYRASKDPIVKGQIKLHCIERAKKFNDEKDIRSIFSSLEKAEAKANKENAKSELATFDISDGISALVTYSRSNKIEEKISNFLAIMRNDEYYSSFKFNTLANRREVCTAITSPDAVFTNGKAAGSVTIRSWSNADNSRSRQYLQDRYGLFNKEYHKDALQILFDERLYNPIVDILNALDPWDNTPRAEEFFIKYGKADDTKLNRAITRVMFDGLYKRAVEPGCKFDYVPILIGKQGCGKSTLVKYLALNDSYFGELKSVKNEQRATERILGKFVIEFPELLAVKNEEEADVIKAFVTSQKDEYRKPYDEYSEQIPRHCIFVGTSNDRQFLSDLTGGRRWLPIHLYASKKDGRTIVENREEITDYIKQCYAEAKYRYENNLSEYVIPYELEQEAETLQKDSLLPDDLQMEIENYIADLPIGEEIFVKRIKLEVMNLGEDEILSKSGYQKDSKRINDILHSFDCLDYSDKVRKVSWFTKDEMLKHKQGLTANKRTDQVRGVFTVVRQLVQEIDESTPSD